jgi:hypothetical protein
MIEDIYQCQVLVRISTNALFISKFHSKMVCIFELAFDLSATWRLISLMRLIEQFDCIFEDFNDVIMNFNSDIDVAHQNSTK